MKRREIVIGSLALAAMVVPLRANAQAEKANRPPRIVTLPDFVPLLRAWFLDAMRELRWTNGRDFVLVESGVQLGQHETADAVRRIVAEQPDLVLASSTAYALDLHRASATIPVVMLTSGYPVEAGIAQSLARPGKNVTGNTTYAGTEVWGKLLQLLRDVKPGVKRISVLWTYVPPAFPREEVEPCYDELRNAERMLGLKLHIVEVATAGHLAVALGKIDAEQPEALLLTSRLPRELRSTVMQFAVGKRLPTITDLAWRPTVEPQPLMSYGPVFRELMRSAVDYVDKILKGAKASDLPIQRPARFETTVSLKTASAIGITIPQELLLRADEVLE